MTVKNTVTNTDDSKEYSYEYSYEYSKEYSKEYSSSGIYRKSFDDRGRDGYMHSMRIRKDMSYAF